jgi:hypothetical protein
MAEWTRVTGTLTAWNEENATDEDLLAAVQEVLPTDVCPTWFNRDNVKYTGGIRVFSTEYSNWNFSLPIVKNSRVPESKDLTVHLVSYVRDNAVFIGTDVDASVLDSYKPFPGDRDYVDSWETKLTSHCITYGEGFKSDVQEWLGAANYDTQLYTSVISFYNVRINAVDPWRDKRTLLYTPLCRRGAELNKPKYFKPKYLAISPAYKYHWYRPFTYQSVDTPNKVYTQTHGCFFLIGDAEDYAPKAEPAQG